MTTVRRIDIQLSLLVSHHPMTCKDRPRLGEVFLKSLISEGNNNYFNDRKTSRYGNPTIYPTAYALISLRKAVDCLEENYTPRG